MSKHFMQPRDADGRPAADSVWLQKLQTRSLDETLLSVRLIAREGEPQQLWARRGGRQVAAKGAGVGDGGGSAVGDRSARFKAAVQALPRRSRHSQVLRGGLHLAPQPCACGDGVDASHDGDDDSDEAAHRGDYDDDDDDDDSNESDSDADMGEIDFEFGAAMSEAAPEAAPEAALAPQPSASLEPVVLPKEVGPVEVAEGEPSLEPPQPHKPYWLTRTARHATCKGCGQAIAPNEFRLLFEPDKAKISDIRVWSKVFWTYHHLKARCLRTLEAPLVVESVMTDIAPLAKRFKESPSDREEATAAAMLRLQHEFEASRPSH